MASKAARQFSRKCFSPHRVFAAFRRIVAKTGAAVVVVTHDMALAARTDRRIHIVDGRIV